jgi:hypothetical protein
MNAGTVATWAAQNGFQSLDAWIYRRHDDNRRLTLEIKRASVVLIEERAGARPRVTARRFKDMRFDGESGKLEGLLAAG